MRTIKHRLRDLGAYVNIQDIKANNRHDIGLMLIGKRRFKKYRLDLINKIKFNLEIVDGLRQHLGGKSDYLLPAEDITRFTKYKGRYPTAEELAEIRIYGGFIYWFSHKHGASEDYKQSVFYQGSKASRLYKTLLDKAK